MTGETNNFEIGQKVKLNTGGPEMSVENVQGNICVCRWFKDGVAKTDKFVDKCLVLAVRPSPIIHGKRRRLAASQN